MYVQEHSHSYSVLSHSLDSFSAWRWIVTHYVSAVHIHTYIPTYMHTYVHTYHVHACIHADTHTHTHTHTHIHTHTYCHWLVIFPVYTVQLLIPGWEILRGAAWTLPASGPLFPGATQTDGWTESHLHWCKNTPIFSLYSNFVCVFGLTKCFFYNY